MGRACGIGLATATGLQRFGARVAIGDIDQSAVKEAGGRAHARLPLLHECALGFRR